MNLVQHKMQPVPLLKSKNINLMHSTTRIGVFPFLLGAHSIPTWITWRRHNYHKRRVRWIVWEQSMALATKAVRLIFRMCLLLETTSYKLYTVIKVSVELRLRKVDKVTETATAPWHAVSLFSHRKKTNVLFFFFSSRKKWILKEEMVP